MKNILNRTFFHLTLGFVSIVIASLVIVFSVGVYQTELANKQSGGDSLATPPNSISR